jgi:hypothetical protein
MKQNYRFEEFTVDELQELVKSGKIILPRFQRDLVWSKAQVNELAYSLRIGIPFGTFLMAGKEPFRLLDGLQRANAMLQIYERPQSYFKKDQVDPELLEKIIKLLRDHGGRIPEKADDQVSEAIESWVKGQENTDTSLKFKGLYLATYLFNRFFATADDALVFVEADELLSPLISTIHEEIKNIEKIKIPCIIYEGDDANLPLIFEKLNSTGTKLSKFQIFAANWADYYLPIMKDKRIKKKVYEDYNNRQTEGKITIDNLPSENEFYKQDLNLYEYLLGLGRCLEEDYPSLFGNNGDSIGFNLAAACLQGSIKKIIEINSIIHEGFRFDEFQKALFDSVRTVFGQLKSYITLKINKSEKYQNSTQIIFHSDYQIVSFIAKVFREKFNLTTFAENPTWRNQNGWIKYIPLHYLYDQIEDNWRGSGDKRIETMLESNRYQEPISREIWISTLMKWFSEKELTKRQTKRTSIDDEDILFLNFIYNRIFTVHDVLGPEEFQLEHLVPVKKLTDFISSTKSPGLPISAVSNLCYIDKGLNQRKSKQTIYQYLRDNPEEINIYEIEEKCTFTTESEMEFVELLTGKRNDEGWQEMYTDFLRIRFQKLVDKFLELNHID